MSLLTTGGLDRDAVFPRRFSVLRQEQFDAVLLIAGRNSRMFRSRQLLFRYKLHKDNELFNRAYGYIQAYY